MTDKPKRKHSDSLAQWYHQQIFSYTVRFALLGLYILFVPLTGLLWFASSGLATVGAIIVAAILVWTVGYMTGRITIGKYKQTDNFVRIVQGFNKALYSIASLIFVIPYARFVQMVGSYIIEDRKINLNHIIIPVVMILILIAIMSYSAAFFINFLGQLRAKYDYFVNNEQENMRYDNLSSIKEMEIDPSLYWTTETESIKHKMK